MPRSFVGSLVEGILEYLLYFYHEIRQYTLGVTCLPLVQIHKLSMVTLSDNKVRLERI
jgi:hypothetical protein